MPRSIDAVLFDFGGVFTDSPFGAAREAPQASDVSPERILEIVFGPYHEDTDHPWHRLERGELSFPDAREQIIAIGIENDVQSDPLQLLASVRGGSRTHQVMIDRVRDLQGEGIQTALVTNNVREFREAWRRMIPVEELFDVIVDSSEVGMRKPNPEIFRHTLALLGNVAPRRTVFLDDHHGNVAAAERLGIRGILVGADPTDALARLDALLGIG